MRQLADQQGLKAGHDNGYWVVKWAHPKRVESSGIARVMWREAWNDVRRPYDRDSCNNILLVHAPRFCFWSAKVWSDREPYPSSVLWWAHSYCCHINPNLPPSTHSSWSLPAAPRKSSLKIPMQTPFLDAWFAWAKMTLVSTLKIRLDRRLGFIWNPLRRKNLRPCLDHEHSMGNRNQCFKFPWSMIFPISWPFAWILSTVAAWSLMPHWSPRSQTYWHFPRPVMPQSPASSMSGTLHAWECIPGGIAMDYPQPPRHDKDDTARRSNSGQTSPEVHWLVPQRLTTFIMLFRLLVEMPRPPTFNRELL